MYDLTYKNDFGGIKLKRKYIWDYAKRKRLNITAPVPVPHCSGLVTGWFAVRCRRPGQNVQRSQSINSENGFIFITYSRAGQLQPTEVPHILQGPARGPQLCTHISKAGGTEFN
jgi:hypothetical protein